MPPLPAAGVPARVAVPFWLSLKVTLPDSVPLHVSVVAVGNPGLVVMGNVPGAPTANVVVLLLVIVGASATVRVKDGGHPGLDLEDRAGVVAADRHLAAARDGERRAAGGWNAREVQDALGQGNGGTLKACHESDGGARADAGVDVGQVDRLT